MKIRSSILVFILLLPVLSQAQDFNNKILMTVGGNKVDAGEFIRMYNKSSEPGKKLDIDNYLQQFIVFKLKVVDALNSGYDTTRAFRTELNGYRSQLAQNYLTDTLVRKRLLQKAYKRSLTEINAWHILVALPPDASPDDTINAWRKAIDIRERVMRGEPFEQVARSTSDDPSVKINGGNLGYFTVFQMIMPFEDAAYSMKKGEISEPVRTPYGYHIIKVADKRPSQGKVKVAHIMKAVPPGTDEERAERAKEQIDSVYMKLQNGASFADLARKYSDHRASAVKGGELNWFGAGDIISGFAEAAFAIKDTGEFTRPIHTVYGWHIIKLLDRKAPGSFSETKSYLESKINDSYLNSLSKRSFIEKLKKEYNFIVSDESYNWFIHNTDTLIMQGIRKYNRKDMPTGNLYTFADQSLTTTEFADYIEQGTYLITHNITLFIDKAIETSISDKILSYENSMLERKYPEFRYLMKEFHDGILLFEISGKKVWNRVTTDSTGLKDFYNEHKNEYLTKRSIEGKLYIFKSPAERKAFKKAYRKYSRKSNTDILLSDRFNKSNDTLLTITNGRWHKGENSDLDRLKWSTGSQSFIADGYPAIININRVYNPEPESFNKIKGEIMTAYQDYLDKEWVKQLKADYPVLIDNSVLDEIRKNFNNE